MQSTFEKIAAKIESDVEEYNRLDQINEKSTFMVKRHSVSTFIVGEKSPGGGWMANAPQVILSINHNHIQATIKDKILFVLKQCWNIETLECNLIIDEKSWSLSEISQMAIGDLLFDELPDSQ